MPKHPAKSPATAPDTASAAATRARLDALLQTLYGYYHTVIGLDLTRLPRLLHTLGDPHLRLPPVVHVAGTNGKGSTVATLRALLEASGARVHVATSPHLVRPNERIRLAGNLISDDDLLAVLEEVVAVNDGAPITFFEIFMAATFLAFSRVPADYTLLETGLGGRLDATNVVPHPVCTIITTISHDHGEFLGDTLPKIAAEKAGIMKPGVPCIIGKQTREALDAGVMKVFQTFSQGLSPAAPLLINGSDWSSAPESGQMQFGFGDASYLLPVPNLLGPHQIANAGAALAALRVIAPERFDADILSTGLQQIDWPGRLQTLENRQLQGLVPAGWEILIDGGHNDSAGVVLAEQAQLWAKEDPRPLHLIVGMVTRKTPAEFLGPLAPHAASLTCIAIPGDSKEAASYTPDELAERAAPMGFARVTTAPSIADALAALPKDGPPARVLITGSLYLIGHILAA
jgi:dihydrofolate synthase/folylpolyglutamate synthase